MKNHNVAFDSGQVLTTAPYKIDWLHMNQGRDKGRGLRVS